MAVINGDDLDNILTGTATADFIAGNGGNDQLSGGSGDDDLYGGDGDDHVSGDAGNDLIDGGAGRDVLAGGAGDDAIYVGRGDGDVATGGDGDDAIYITGGGTGEVADGGAGIDLLHLEISALATPITISMADPDVEQVLADGTRIIGFEKLEVWGGLGGDVLTGGDLNDVLRGGGGDDTIQGGGAFDSLWGDAGNDIIDGGAASDELLGGTGNDRLDGGSGDDVLRGEAGDDELHGGDGNDSLSGSESAGEGGHDILYGDAGDDTLLGGTDPIELHGGTGDDAYVIAQFGAVIVEAAGEGTDTVYTTVSFRLPDNVENLVLNDAPRDGARGVGNALDNVISVDSGQSKDVLLYGAAGDDTLHGGQGSDYLDGGTGADRMDGGAGNDTYVVGDRGDVVTELADQGIDTVRSAISYHLGANVENLVLFGGGAAAGTGNTLDNVLTGNGAANVLTGGHGADTFVFDTALSDSNVDRITDFAPGVDTIRLDPLIFTGVSPGTLSPAAFALGTVAQDADDRILYDSATGALRYDPDGAGGHDAQLFATVTPGIALSAADFLVG